MSRLGPALLALAALTTLPIVGCTSSPGLATYHRDKIEYRDADLREVLAELGRESGLSIVVHPRVQGRISCVFERRPARETLRSIVHRSGYVLVHELEGGVDVYHIVPRENLRVFKRTG